MATYYNSELETKMDRLLPTQVQRQPAPDKMKVIMMTMIVFQTVVSAAILCILISLAPEIRKTLSDVSVTLPEMRLTVERLTWMVPEVTRAIEILDRVCVALGMSNCSK